MKKDSRAPSDRKSPTNSKWQNVALSDFADSFGVSISGFSDGFATFVNGKDYGYRILIGEERDNVILNVLSKIESDQQVIGSRERKNVWENGWAENLREYTQSNYDITKLVPKFIRPSQVIRLNRNYVLPRNPDFELDYLSAFRLWLFTEYFKEYDHIYEFGCGSGFNLVELACMYPEKNIHGLDFVPSSCEIVNKLAENNAWKMKGHIFDMISPDEDFEIADNSVVYTIGAIEQLASKFEPFLQFLLKRSPSLCIHVEPTIELYDQNNLVDYLAIKFHRKRGYTENFLTRLRQLETENKIELIKVKRLFFGSLYMEGYSLMIWRPT